MYKNKVTVFIPDSFLLETNDLKLKTYKVGIIGRALAVFRVNQVVIYKDSSNSDDNRKNDANFINEVLSYMNTPQYLRRKVFPIKAELKHVGILPPLRTPHHPTNDSPDIGDYRQGFTVKRNKKGTFVDIGMENLAFCKEQLTVNKVFSFKITKIAKEVIVTPDEPDDIYWGYKTLFINKGLKNALEIVKPHLVIETTRYANIINSVFNELEYKVNDSKDIAILFGGPYSSIKGENIESSNWEVLKVNTIPCQGTETVRTEEAVIATLSLINLMLNK